MAASQHILTTGTRRHGTWRMLRRKLQVDAGKIVSRRACEQARVEMAAARRCAAR